MLACRRVPGVDCGSKEELYRAICELIVLTMAKVESRTSLIGNDDEVGMELVRIPRYATWWGIAFLTLRPDP